MDIRRTASHPFKSIANLETTMSAIIRYTWVVLSTLVILVVAQSDIVMFLNTPVSVEAGTTVTIEYIGGGNVSPLINLLELQISVFQRETNAVGRML